jgi:hypothetical protein
MGFVKYHIAVSQGKITLRKLLGFYTSLLSRKLCCVHIKKIIIYRNNIKRLVLIIMKQCFFFCEMNQVCTFYAEGIQASNNWIKKLSLFYQIRNIRVSPF